MFIFFSPCLEINIWRGRDFTMFHAYSTWSEGEAVVLCLASTWWVVNHKKASTFHAATVAGVLDCLCVEVSNQVGACVGCFGDMRHLWLEGLKNGRTCECVCLCVIVRWLKTINCSSVCIWARPVFGPRDWRANSNRHSSMQDRGLRGLGFDGCAIKGVPPTSCSLWDRSSRKWDFGLLGIPLHDGQSK